MARFASVSQWKERNVFHKKCFCHSIFVSLAMVNSDWDFLCLPLSLTSVYLTRSLVCYLLLLLLVSHMLGTCSNSKLLSQSAEIIFRILAKQSVCILSKKQRCFSSRYPSTVELIRAHSLLTVGALKGKLQNSMNERNIGVLTLFLWLCSLVKTMLI